MNKKMRELLAKIKEKNSQARNFQNEGKVDEAKQLIDEIKDLQTSYENEKALFEMERNKVPDSAAVTVPVSFVSLQLSRWSGDWDRRS